MPSQSGVSPDTAVASTRGVGVLFIVTLMVSLGAVLGFFHWPRFVMSLGLPDESLATIENATLVLMLLGSAVALVLAIATANRLMRRRRRRTWVSIIFVVAAVATALPGIYFGSSISFDLVYSQLPLTTSDRVAIELAETFVRRNGYTTAGHPADLPVLQNDIMDSLAGSEANLLATRKGTLQAEARGIKYMGFYYMVFFDTAAGRPSGGAYRTLVVGMNGDVEMMHSDMYPGIYKSIAR
ncbi:hypothetical protein ACQQ2N_01105 [Dokdonella sp. MW10]|uniref:hypothetical protein n=1 Tax=Dokdonella sp. MW10 TaxID=2992926 RepID=UPI003F8234CD